MRRLHFLILATFPLVAAPSVHAQSLSLGSGSLIRIAATDGSFGEYRLVEITADTLVLRDTRSGQIRVGTADLTSLSVRRTYSDAGRNATIGLGLGAGVGIALGLLAGGPEGSMFPRGEMASGLGLVLGMGGLAVGALIGAATSESVWEPVVLPVSAGFDPSGARVGMSYSPSRGSTSWFP